MTSETTGTPKMIVPYEWILENVEGKPMTIASKMILFRGEKVFRVGLKNHARNPILFVVAIGLNKIGMEVEDVIYGIQGSGLSPVMMTKMTKENIGEEGSLQLFTIKLAEQFNGQRTFVFRICIQGTRGYSFQLSDRLAKDQLWDALKSQQNLADVELIVKDKSFPAHKAILAARSRVFADEFEKVQPVKDVPHLQIRIDGAEPSTVLNFLHFIYTGEPMGTLADEELLKLADRYQLTTLSSLCQHALKEMDSVQMAKVRKRLYNGKAEELSYSSKIMPEKETEIFFDRTTHTFRCTSTFQILAGGNEQPKCVMQYQNENICIAYFTGEVEYINAASRKYYYIAESVINFSCAKHRRFGLKVEDIYCSHDGYNEWLKMESKYSQKNSELLLHFSAQSQTAFGHLSPSFNFDVKFISTIGNYYYEMMDDLWLKDFWVAATNEKVTDVEIFVGTVKVMEAHRVILCARSPVLNESFSKISNVVSKPIVTFGAEFDVEVVKHFLNFLYTGSLKSTDNVQQLSKLATMYEVETLKNVCQPFQHINANQPDVEEVTDYLLQL